VRETKRGREIEGNVKSKTGKETVKRIREDKEIYKGLR
jgi:hypothetical protein